MSVQAGVEQTNSQGQQMQQNNDAGTGNVQAPESQQQTQQQQNPAPYTPYLEKLPESVRGLVEPVFREWDAGVTQRFQQLHSQFGWAEPWQEIAQEYDPETVSQSLMLLQSLSTDPEGFYKALGETYGYTPAQAQQIVEQGLQQQQGSQSELPPEIAQRLSSFEQTLGTLAEGFLSKQQQEEEAAEEQAFMEHLNQLRQTHGDFDLDYVITKVAAGMDPEQAVTSYRALIGQQAQQLIAPGQQTPVVMPGSGGGGVPSSSVDIRKLDRKATQDLVANVLAANNSQG